MNRNGYWWKISLELKLRRVHGEAFQDFFSDIMDKLHPGDFVRTRPIGSKGDKGCDGYLRSTGEIFQCYGALNGKTNNHSNFIRKMGEDFIKAKSHLSDIMKKWTMAHNLIHGVSTDAVNKLESLRKNNPGVDINFAGLEKIKILVGQLSDEDMHELLGPLATEQDSQNMQIPELRDLIQGLITAAEDSGRADGVIEPVPVDKIDSNQLSGEWRLFISGGWQNSYIVSDYFDQHHDPLLGEKIADIFRERYAYLKYQSLQPDDIMCELYEFTTGTMIPPPERQVVAQALLAHFFESCDIFENITQELSK